MKRIMLRVAYDGTAYCGWQLQPGVPSIEGELNKALSKLIGSDVHVTGASRTDAGVHSLGNVAVFDTDSPIPAEKMAFAVNARLPEDIAVQESAQVREDFHPRKCSCVKTYEYNIFTGRMPNPLLAHYTWHRYGQLDTAAMEKAGHFLEGEHDFSSFCAANDTALTHVRTIYAVRVSQERSLVRITVKGNGFLYNMVRIIAGTLLTVGSGKKRPEDMPAVLESCDRRQAGVTAPACGLTQIGIEFKNIDLYGADYEREEITV